MSDIRAEDTRSSEELVEAHRRELQDEDSLWDAMWTLRDRGGREEFEIGRQLTQSDIAEVRTIGADLLAQLGSGSDAFREDSISILVRLLGDTDCDVVASAAIGLGHRRSSEAAPSLVALTDHDNPGVREAVVHGLLTQEDPRAVATLIRMSRDVDSDTRNWATFGLGSMIETDTPELRDALAARLSDDDREVRGEAVVGLAQRRDLRALEAVRVALGHDDVGTLQLEAAELIADPSLVPDLTRLLGTLRPEDDDFRQGLLEALAACESGPRST